MRRGGLLHLTGKYLRMTRDDIVQLASVFAQVASRQARDVATAIDRRARSAIDARRR